MNKFIQFLVHPFFIAGLISLAIIWAIPTIFVKYDINQLNSYILSNSEKIHIFYDLNNDGNSEEIYIHPKSNKQNIFSLFIKDHKGRVLDEWPIKDVSYLRSKNNLFFSDINKNKLKELCFLAYKEDSIFLFAMEPYSSEYLIKKRFIQKVHSAEKFIDATVKQWQTADLNNDGYPEILFNIIAGYAQKPRNIYAYDYKKDTLWKTAEAGNTLSTFRIGDIDADGEIEIYGDMSTTGNCENTDGFCNDSVPYTDYTSWAMQFNKDLSIQKPVIGFSGLGAWNQVYMSSFYDQPCLMIFSGSSNYKSPKKLTLKIYNQVGLSLFEREFNIAHGYTKLRTFNNKPQILVFDDEGRIYTLEDKYKLKLLYDGSKTIDQRFIEIIDINDDGSDEVIMCMKDKTKMILFDDEFNNPTILDLEKECIGNYYLSVDKNDNTFNAFSLQIGKYWFHFEYKENPLFGYRYIIYLFIYLLTASFFYILFMLQQTIIKKKYEMKKQLMQFQFRSLRNQLDPHFTLNMLNAIQTLIYTENFSKSKIVLSQYTKLNRIALMNADKIANSLEKELEFIESYLNLQKFRFDDSFNFSIKINDEVNEEQDIPRMLILSFVENALKYGVRELSNRKGNIIISANQTSSTLVIAIEDNGIGRKKSKEKLGIISKKGNTIIKNIVVLYNKLNKTHITYHISDILNNNEIAGTKVEIIVPLIGG